MSISSRHGVNAVRILGGDFKGQLVAVPHKARPTEGRVREALFSIWQERLEGARLLDLFAGSGAVAIEAVSRGALSATCLEGDLAAVRRIEDNARRLGLGTVEVKRLSLPGGLERFVPGREASFDLAYADPPYDFRAHEKLLRAVTPLLAPDGEIVLEHSRRTATPELAGEWVRTDERRYGECGLSFYRRMSTHPTAGSGLPATGDLDPGS